MIKFTIKAEELKVLVNKGIALMGKKPTVTESVIYFKVDTSGGLLVIAKQQDMDKTQWLEVTARNVYNTEPGIVGIGVDILQVILKLKGELTISTISQESVKVVCGVKQLTLPLFSGDGLGFPSETDGVKEVLSIQEGWLLDTVTSLASYTDTKHSMGGRDLGLIYFDTVNKQVQVCDGYRLGVRDFRDYVDVINQRDIAISVDTVPLFKQVLSKASNNRIDIQVDNEMYYITGVGFRYACTQNSTASSYITLLQGSVHLWEFQSPKAKLLDIVKSSVGFSKLSKQDVPMYIGSKDGQLCFYTEVVANGKGYTSLDKVTTIENTMPEKLFIGVKPKYLADVLSTVDSGMPVVKGSTMDSAIYVYGESYSFVVMPVRLSEARVNCLEDVFSCI